MVGDTSRVIHATSLFFFFFFFWRHDDILRGMPLHDFVQGLMTHLIIPETIKRVWYPVSLVFVAARI